MQGILPMHLTNNNLRFSFYIFLFLLPIVVYGQILPAHPATALNKVILYPDSSFFQHSTTTYEEGDLFEILDETRYEHEDAAQNQKFKWFYVRTPDRKKGWIYGDGLAISQEQEELTGVLKNYHLKEIAYSGKGEKVIAWIAAIEGKDNFHEEDHLNPLYKEQYLVLTSSLKKSVHIQLSGMSAMGINELKELRFTDINGNGVVEVLLINSSLDNSSSLEGRSLEIYAFQAGSIAKVFEERMTLTYEGSQPSPALFKIADIGEQTIRIAYVDYVACEEYSIPLETNEVSKTQERCIEYVTYTYIWDELQQNYQPLYEESRTYLQGTLQEEKYALRREPSYLGEVVEHLTENAPLTIIKHYEKIIKRKDKKVVVPYLYVKTSKGNYGYLHADKVKFLQTEHAALLNEYYQNPPLLKSDWTSNTHFLYFKKDINQVVTGSK